MSKNLLTPPGTLNFVHLFSPTSLNDDRPDELYYNVAMVFDEQAQNTPEWAAIRQAVIDAAHAKFGNNVNLAALKMPILDCAKKAGTSGYDVPNGKYMNLKTKQRPQIVDFNRQLILDPNLVYAGCLARASVNFRGYDHTRGGKGISVRMANLQVLDNNEERYPRIDGRVAAHDEFSAVTPPEGAPGAGEGAQADPILGGASTPSDNAVPF